MAQHFAQPTLLAQAIANDPNKAVRALAQHLMPGHASTFEAYMLRMDDAAYAGTLDRVRHALARSGRDVSALLIAIEAEAAALPTMPQPTR